MAQPLPAKTKRTLWRGDSRTWTHVFDRPVLDGDGQPVLDEDGSPTREPIDLTGYEFTAEFREDTDRGTVVCSSVCVVTDGPNGVVTETLTSAQADLLPGQSVAVPSPKVYWDLQSVDPDDDVRTWLYCDVPVKGDRTNG